MVTLHRTVLSVRNAVARILQIPATIIIGNAIVVGIVSQLWKFSIKNMSNISLLAEKAESGDIQAMRQLAMAYMEGNGVERDADEVFNWFEKAAELGDAESQADLAEMLRAIEVLDEALYWEQKAAEQEWASSQHNLAVCFKDGIGTHVDIEKQFYWYRKAAENGNVLSQLQLSRCYVHGDGTTQDLQQAVFWLRQASEKGNAEAKRRLGAAYIQGFGCSVDKEKGVTLLREAVALGDGKAREILKEVQEGGLEMNRSSGCVLFAALGTLLISGICGLALFAPVFKF